MARPAADHDEVRRRAVVLGRDLVARGGADRLLLADVASGLGLAAPSLYHYFANRRALVLAVLAAEIQDLLAVWPADDVGDGSEEHLDRFLDSQVRYLQSTSPHTVAFVLDAVLEAGDEAVAAVVAPAFGRAEAVFRRYCRNRARPWDARTADAWVDLLRSTLAGLFVLRAVGTRFDAAAALVPLRTAMGAPPRSLSKSH